MNKNKCSSIVINYYKLNIFKFLLAYIIFGVLIFTFSNMELSYVNMIYYIMGHPYLIAFFLLPVSIFTTFHILSNLSKNKELIIRFNNRLKLFKFEMKILFLNITFIILIFLFITLLFANLFSDRNHFILDDPYYPEINNLLGLIFCLLKLYLFTLSIAMMNIALKDFAKGSFNIVMNILILISFLGYIPTLLDWLFPSHYLGYSFRFDSIFQNLFYSFIYLFIYFVCSFIFCKQKILNKDFV